MQAPVSAYAFSPTVGPTLNGRLSGLSDYPFARLARLLADVTPRANLDPLALSLGEPQHQPPALLDAALRDHAHLWSKYPPTDGTPRFREAAAGWLTRRYGLPDGFVDPATILPAAGTREALFMLPLLAVPQQTQGRTPVVLLPNPFYAPYEGGAVAAGAEPVFLPAFAETGFLPDLSAIPEETLARTALLILCSPANPQGVVADKAYLVDAIRLARRYGFVLAVDECYADIYDREPPVGALEAALALDGSLDNLLIFHSLSKRFSAAGLRSGFVMGDPALIRPFARLRSYANAGNPLPALAAAAALWDDDTHAAENRDLYRRKIDAAEAELAGKLGFYRPPGGFFLWLDMTDGVGDGETAATLLWREAAIRTLPGAYITRPEPDGTNRGAPYLRIALVHETDTVARACAQIARILA